MKTKPPVLVLAASLVALAGCVHFGPKKPVVPEATLPMWIGRIVMVDAVHRFVLIDAGSARAPAVGRNVVTVRDKRQTAVLRVTAEARAPYIAMDIMEGEPALGDQAALEEVREPPAPADSPVAP